MTRAADFWSFMLERERIRLARARGFPREQWTSDPIFREYSFTNVKREHDRTTVLLREIYADHYLNHPSPVALLNATLFRMHGTVESARRIGWHRDWTPEDRARLVLLNGARRLAGEKIFTSAYIIPNCGESTPKHELVARVVTDVWHHAFEVLATYRWEVACDSLCDIHGVGQFLAKEILLDYMLITGWLPTDWEFWTPVGPGARRGASVVKYDEIRKIPMWEALEVCRDLYAERQERWPEDFIPLSLTDIQFQLCEFAKYEKVVRGVGRPRARFTPTVDKVTRQEDR